MIAHITNTTKQNHKDDTTNHNVPSQRGSLSLILVDQGQAYNSKHKPHRLKNEIIWFGVDGFSLVMILTLLKSKSIRTDRQTV